MPTRTAESKTLKEEYEKNGYLLVHALLTPEEVKRIRARFEQIWNEGVPGKFERTKEGVITDLKENYPRIVHPHRFDELSKRYLLDPRITDIVALLLEDEPLAAQTMYYWKPPGTKGQALHQDNLYLRADESEVQGGCMAAWIAIDRCDEENGCLQVVPGSHKLDLKCPESANPEESYFGDFVKPPEGFRVEPMIMNPGDCLFFGGHTIHGSGPNRSKERFRRSFICHYIGSRSKESATFYNPLLKMNGEEVWNEASTMGSPCGTAFEGPH